MRCKNNFFLMIISLVLVPTSGLAPLTVLSSCQDRCGGIEIPYPFGIGKGCYLDDWYEIECKNGTLPFLSKISMEVVSISFSRPDIFHRPSMGSIRVKNMITTMGCSNDGKDFQPPLNLTGSPFFFGTSNKLIAVGCNVKASLLNVEPSLVGCESACDASNVSHSIPFFDKIGCSAYSENLVDTYKPVCNIKKKLEDTLCYGKECCQESVRGEAQQVIGVRIESINENSTTRGECRVAFLTDDVYTLTNATRPELLLAKGYATLELGWFIQTKNISFLNSLSCHKHEFYNNSGLFYSSGSCACTYAIISEISYANCLCIIDSNGNPYLPGGCKNLSRMSFVDTGFFVMIMTAVVTCFAVSILIGGIWCLLKNRRVIKRKKKFFKRNGGLLLQQQLMTTEGNVDKTRVFRSKELKKATDNFSETMILGHGGQGTVYKGILLDGKTVAIKKSRVVDEDKLNEFINEVVILSQINHRHVVKLIGCCLETEVPVLVYEFIPNGNLFQLLHGESDLNKIWSIRLRIAKDISGAISYMHSAACSPVYHRDIKSTNILLDENYQAKVSDFGSSRSVTIDHTHWTTLISGTVGYVDPEYYITSQYTEKSDVYSFGVVLAELITGDKPVITLLNSQETRCLSDHFKSALKENRFFDIIDPRVRDNCKLEQVMAVAHLAMRCLRNKGRKRPDMREVFTELEKISSSPEDYQVHIQFDEEEEDEHLSRRNGDTALLPSSSLDAW